MQAAALDKEIYNPTTLPKSYTTKPYFDMMGLSLGTDDILDTPAAVSPAPNAWKPSIPTTHQALLLGNFQPRLNDDRSLTSNNDNASLANTLATFEPHLSVTVLGRYYPLYAVPLFSLPPQLHLFFQSSFGYFVAQILW